MQLFNINDPWTTKLPVKLKDGDQANLSVKIDDIKKNEEYLRLIYSGPFNFVWFKFFKIQATTSTGEVFSTRVNKRVREKYLKLKKEVNPE